MKKRLIWIFVILIVILFITSFLRLFDDNIVGRKIDRANVGVAELSKNVNNIADPTIFKPESQTDLTNKIDETKTEEYRIVRVADTNEELFGLEEAEYEKFKFAYTIDNNGKIKSNLPETSQRDSPGEEYRGAEPELREYFDVNIILDDDNEWIRNERIAFFVYYDDLDISSVYLGDYNFAESIRIDLSEDIERNTFDVILFAFRREINDNGYLENNIFMIEPLLENADNVTFNLSKVERVNTNFDDLNEETGTKIILSDFGIFVNDFIGLVGLGSIFYNKSIQRELNNKVYISEYVFNPTWNFLMASYSTSVNIFEDPKQHLALTITNITYPLENIYEVNLEDLHKISFNIYNVFNFRYVCVSPYFAIYARLGDNADVFVCPPEEIIPLQILPARADVLFTEDNSYGFSWLIYSDLINNVSPDDVNDIPLTSFNSVLRYAFFEDEYNRYEREIILDAVKKPNALKLYNLTSQRFPYPYLRGYVSDNTNLISVRGYPIDYLHFPYLGKARGYMTMMTPRGNIYRANLFQLGGFFIWCDEGEVSDRSNYFSGMECIEGNYTINWSLENIVKDRDLYLNAIVYYDGENWNIVNQDLRIVDLNYCGNGIKEGRERCDGNDWGNVRNCRNLGYNGGRLRCVEPDEIRQRGLIPCRFDTSGCYR